MFKTLFNPGVCASTHRCPSCGNRIMIWSIAANLFLAVLKFLMGMWFNSNGLMADGLQSFSCVVGGLIILYSIHASKKDPDFSHPFGYRKAEFITSLLVYSILFALGIFIFVTNITQLLRGGFYPPSFITFPVAILSILLNYIMFKYSLCAGRELKSGGMKANAYQNKADMLSSCGVSIGILLSQFGGAWQILDPLAAAIVGIIIIRDAYHQWKEPVNIILDKEPEPDFAHKLQVLIEDEMPEAMISSIKLQRKGQKYWAGIVINAPDTWNLKQLDYYMEKIRSTALFKGEHIEEVELFLDSTV
ncbi:MAG: cation transporter [Fibrobacteria bacterium]|nr:cation transporter [Fibrobacteria bacterium]